VDNAKLNLAYCHIVSPVDGRVGLRQVDLGNYVSPGDANGLVVISQLKPITVVFTLPEDSIPSVVAQLRKGTKLPVAAFDRSHTTKLATGTVLSLDNQIDTTTGTLKVKASFANDDGGLFPNQFVNVDLLLNTETGVTLVPQSAVQRGAPGTYVYLVKPEDSTVAVQKVKLGPGNATDVVIDKGLEAGQTVVIDGTDRLKDGAKITLPTADTNAPSTTGQHHRGNGQGGNGQAGGNRQKPQ